MTARFLLVGLAAEMSLHPLAAALRARGLPVSAVDLADRAVDGTVVPPGDGPLVLVTSQHLGMTGAVYDAHVGLATHYVSPQVLRHQVGADLLVYVPHDLAEPILPSEVPLLSGLDLFAAPDDDCWWARAHVPTVVTGWVGTAARLDASADVVAAAHRGVLFLTQLMWLMQQGGAPFVLSRWERTLATGVAVKLPLWPGTATLSDALVGAGVAVLDPRLSASGLIRHAPLVLTNGPSSVLAEAAYAGHRPVCVLPEDGDREFAGQLAGLDLVLCRDADVESAMGSAGVVRAPSPDFDVDLFLSAVDARLRGERL